MSDLELVTYPHPALLKKTKPLEGVDDATRARIDRMFQVMHEERGVGLAAPQVGWSVRLLVLNPSDDPAHDEVLINPRIVKRRGRVLGEEGCLSFPDIFVQVERAREVDIEYLDRNGELRQDTRADFEARIVQHEIDHLDNILLVHRMSPADRLKYKRDLQEMVRGE